MGGQAQHSRHQSRGARSGSRLVVRLRLYCRRASARGWSRTLSDKFLCVAVPILQFNLVSKSLRTVKEACQWNDSERREPSGEFLPGRVRPQLELAESLVYY